MGNFRDDRRGGGFRGGGRSSFGRDRGDRPMFDAICSNCGKPCQVPFRPTNGKPVYCSDCFEKLGKRNDRHSSDRPRFEDRARAPQVSSGPDLGAINAKLDKILSLLEPKVIAPIKKTKGPELVERIADKVDLPKIKKAVKKAASTKSGKAGSSSAGKK